jgi:hypothetical protein
MIVIKQNSGTRDFRRAIFPAEREPAVRAQSAGRRDAGRRP